MLGGVNAMKRKYKKIIFGKRYSARTCPRCGGTGTFLSGEICYYCQGTGEV